MQSSYLIHGAGMTLEFMQNALYIVVDNRYSLVNVKYLFSCSHSSILLLHVQSESFENNDSFFLKQVRKSRFKFIHVI